MSEKKDVNQKARDAAGTIMHKLANLNLNHEEAISALMIGLVISAQGVGVDKVSIIDNLSQNWDVLDNANRPQTH
jgi:hypothetical protein